MSLALIIGAALLIQSAIHLNQVSIGFDAKDVVKAEVMLSIRTYREPSDRAAVMDRLLADIRGVPGVENASVVFPSPFRSIRTMQWDAAGETRSLEAAELVVGDRYFQTLGIESRGGRLFESRDRLGAPRVAIVSDALAARAWPGADPIGRRLRRRAAGQAQLPADWLTVVGVVGETRQTLTATDPIDLYVPFAQQPMRGGTLLVRSVRGTLPPLPSLRAAVASVDPELALAEPDLLANVVAASTSTQRFLAVLLGGLALFASLLAVVGVYGVIAFGVARRERDIALHLCFGASRATVVTMLARQEGLMVCTGLAVGVALAAALARTVGGQLYGIQAGDVTTYVGAAAGLGLVASIAIVGPAMRAAGLDVMAVLRRDVT
jgi:putative ABC transport system permease protein